MKKEDPAHAALLAYNPDYCRREKLIRMYTGCGSSPVSYKDGVVEIEIRLTQKVLEGDNMENVIQSLVKIWMAAVPDAKCYRAHIYNSGTASEGFVMPTANLFDENGKPDSAAVIELTHSIRHIMKAERIDVKIDEREWPSRL